MHKLDRIRELSARKIFLEGQIKTSEFMLMVAGGRDANQAKHNEMIVREAKEELDAVLIELKGLGDEE